MFKRILTVLSLLLLTTAAVASTATVSWTPPTQRVDGTPYTNYGGFKIYYMKVGTDQQEFVIDIPDPMNLQRSRIITDLTPGRWMFSMTAYDSNGLESARSATGYKDIVTAPGHPNLEFVAIATTVWRAVQSDNRFVMVAVGNVPLNTPCDGTQSANGKYAVPVSAVTWLGTVRPKVVFADCSIAE